MVANGAAILTPDEKQRLTSAIFDPARGQIKHEYLGKPAALIAGLADIQRDYTIQFIVVPCSLEELGGPYSREKLAPVISLFMVTSEEEGLAVCKQTLANQGAGHTAVIHTQSRQRAERFGLEIPASRILVNVNASVGILGGIVTGLAPSYTLGCGTYGGNSTTDNVDYTHLRNVKRLALSLQTPPQ